VQSRLTRTVDPYTTKFQGTADCMSTEKFAVLKLFSQICDVVLGQGD
jgi:hypothetical protein